MEAVPQSADLSVPLVDSVEVADLAVDSAEAVVVSMAVAVMEASMEVMAVSSDLFEAVLTVLADLMPSFNATWVAASDAKCF